MNIETLPLTSNELEIIQKKYEKRYSKFKSTSLIAIILGIAALFTPPEVWNFLKVFDKKQGIRNLEDVNEYMFQNPTMIVIVILAVTSIIFLSKYIFINPLKKDLKEKEKIRGQFQITRIENIGKRVSEKLGGLDTILHFEKNTTKIKKHLFNKTDKPELLNAKGIIIEQSKHTGIIFLEKIIQNSINEKIGSELQEQFNQTKKQFLNKRELHPLFEQFKNYISKINIEELISDFEKEIDLNIDAWWTNSEKKVDLNSKILAILFTHRDLADKNPEANVYGVNEVNNPLQIVTESYDLGSHDYADGYYALPGITLTFCKELHKLDYTSLKNTEYEGLDWYDFDGRIELFDSYRFALKYALHKSLSNLEKRNRFNKINSTKPLHFLVQEYHDGKVTPVLIVE
ncbi:hypothetical protein [Maribacter sp. 2307ULW6-5]|uniref:hypothetical protein n=1 Tax=Maribacter sp. 2307ULW6-5 TaxID=3386275 RepID=UPI0039BD1AE1